MDPSSEFRWPELPWPPADWWLAEGIRLGMDEAKIRFVSVLARVAADDPTRAKKNTECARIAGLEGGREKVFRVARSVSARRLLDAAIKIKEGREPPITEAEIDKIVTRLMRSPVASEASKGIELHDKRKAERRAAAVTEHSPKDTLADMCAISPEFAGMMSAAYGLPLEGVPVSDEMRKTMQHGHALIAQDWITANPHRAYEFVKLAMQHRGNGIATHHQQTDDMEDGPDAAA